MEQYHTSSVVIHFSILAADAVLYSTSPLHGAVCSEDALHTLHSTHLPSFTHVPAGHALHAVSPLGVHARISTSPFVALHVAHTAHLG